MGGSTWIILSRRFRNSGYYSSPEPWNDSSRRQEIPLDDIVDLPEGYIRDYVREFPSGPTQDELDVLYTIARVGEPWYTRGDATGILVAHKYNRKRLWRIFLSDDHASVRRTAYEGVPGLYRPFLTIKEWFAP